MLTTSSQSGANYLSKFQDYYDNHKDKIRKSLLKTKQFSVPREKDTGSGKDVVLYGDVAYNYKSGHITGVTRDQDGAVYDANWADLFVGIGKLMKGGAFTTPEKWADWVVEEVIPEQLSELAKAEWQVFNSDEDLQFFLDQGRKPRIPLGLINEPAQAIKTASSQILLAAIVGDKKYLAKTSTSLTHGAWLKQAYVALEDSPGFYHPLSGDILRSQQAFNSLLDIFKDAILSKDEKLSSDASGLILELIGDSYLSEYKYKSSKGTVAKQNIRKLMGLILQREANESVAEIALYFDNWEWIHLNGQRQKAYRTLGKLSSIYILPDKLRYRKELKRDFPEFYKKYKRSLFH